MKFWLPFLIVGSMLLGSYPRVAIACRGPFPASTQAVFAKSTAVFYGRVLTIVEVAPHPSLPGSKLYEAKFQVYRWWKGVPKQQVKVRFDTTSCGAHFEQGQNYLVFASGSPLGTSAMSMNRLIFKPNEELKPIVQEFGQGQIPR